VVVDDLDIEGVAAFETKAQSPLLVDADAPLAGSIAFQGFEAIGRRLAQVSDSGGEMQVLEATHRAAHDFPWKPQRSSTGEQPFRFLVGEAPYHPAGLIHPVDFRSSSINNAFMQVKSVESIHV
jgi:hypothetical protein